jgi:hypothetical protein
VNFLLLFGATGQSCKTTLWQLCAETLDLDAHHISSLQLTSKQGRAFLERFLAAACHAHSAKRARHLLLVFDGPLVEELETFALPLVQSINYAVTSAGRLISPGQRKIKVVLETPAMAGLSPGMINVFTLINCQNTTLDWLAYLRSNFRALIVGDKAESLSDKQEALQTEIEKRVRIFRQCRKEIGIADSLGTDCVNILNFLQLAKAAKTVSLSDPAHVSHVLLFASLFSFTQDLGASDRDKIELMIRQHLDCFSVPTEHSMYEYYFDPDVDGGTWLHFCDAMPADSTVLARHAKLVKLSHLLMTSMSNVELAGSKGVGKSTVLKELFRHPAFDSDLALVFKCAASSDVNLLVAAVCKAMREKERSKGAYLPLGSGASLRVMVDNVNVPQHDRQVSPMLTKPHSFE